MEKEKDEKMRTPNLIEESLKMVNKELRANSTSKHVYVDAEQLPKESIVLMSGTPINTQKRKSLDVYMIGTVFSIPESYLLFIAKLTVNIELLNKFLKPLLKRKNFTKFAVMPSAYINDTSELAIELAICGHSRKIVSFNDEAFKKNELVFSHKIAKDMLFITKRLPLTKERNDCDDSRIYKFVNKILTPKKPSSMFIETIFCFADKFKHIGFSLLHMSDSFGFGILIMKQSIQTSLYELQDEKYKYVFPKGSRLFIIGCNPPKLNYKIGSAWVFNMDSKLSFDNFISDIDNMDTPYSTDIIPLEKSGWFKKIKK